MEASQHRKVGGNGDAKLKPAWKEHPTSDKVFYQCSTPNCKLLHAVVSGVVDGQVQGAEEAAPRTDAPKGEGEGGEGEGKRYCED